MGSRGGGLLAEKLEGYDNYGKRVRYRLIPLLW
jgi:protein-S-isoprenylcysteine O-methyltransferase Ste14